MRKNEVASCLLPTVPARSLNELQAVTGQVVSLQHASAEGLTLGASGCDCIRRRY